MHNNDDDTTSHCEEDAPHLDDEANLSQGMMSLPNISASDEDTRKAIARKAAWQSDVQYGNWQDEQICQGNNSISQWDKMAHDYTEVGKTSKAPDNMEECGAFKPLDTTGNPLGLCQFYCTDPETAKSVPAPKPQLPFVKLSAYWKRPEGKGSLIP